MAFKRRVDPRLYNGATLVGLKGVVFKSHGGADATAFRVALAKAHAEVARGVLDRIAQRIAAMPRGRARRGGERGSRPGTAFPACLAASPAPAATCPRRC